MKESKEGKALLERYMAAQGRMRAGPASALVTRRANEVTHTRTN